MKISLGVSVKLASLTHFFQLKTFNVAQREHRRCTIGVLPFLEVSLERGWGGSGWWHPPWLWYQIYVWWNTKDTDVSDDEGENDDEVNDYYDEVNEDNNCLTQFSFRGGRWGLPKLGGTPRPHCNYRLIILLSIELFYNFIINNSKFIIL